MNINFLTPVDYLNNSDVYFSSLQTMADNYFYYGGSQHRAYVIAGENNSYHVQLVPCKASSLTTALKIASLATLAIPLIMLFIKAINRLGKQFTILNDSQLSNHPKACEVLVHGHQRESSFDPSIYKARYSAMFANAGIDYSQATALQKHVAFFADGKGQITRQSMQEGFVRLRLGTIKSWLLSLIVFRGLASSTGSTNGVIRLQDISKGKHLSGTETFTADGSFDPTSFERFRLFAKTAPELLTADEFALLRSLNKKRDRDLPGANTGALASKGEFDLLLTLFADRYVIDAYGNARAAISFERLRTMYTDGPLLFDHLSSSR